MKVNEIKVLIIEDDLSLQNLYCVFLKHLNIQDIQIANNGSEAVEIFKSFPQKPKLILMDYRMPVKNGIDATKEILALDNTSKILFLSADNSILNEALSIGACDFLSKPFRLTELQNKIQSALMMDLKVEYQQNK